MGVDLIRLLATIATLPVALGVATAHAGPRIERNVPYRRVGDATLTLNAYLPSPVSSRRAAIIFVRVNGWRAGDKSAFAPGEPTFVPTALRLTRLGFAVFRSTIDSHRQPLSRPPPLMSLPTC